MADNATLCCSRFSPGLIDIRQLNFIRRQKQGPCTVHIVAEYILHCVVDFFFLSVHIISVVQAGMKAGVWAVISCLRLRYLDVKPLGCDRSLLDLQGVHYSAKHTRKS